MKKRITAALLILCLMFTMLPQSAFAISREKLGLKMGSGILKENVGNDSAATVYYGKGVNNSPFAWRVVSYNGNGPIGITTGNCITLLASDVLGQSSFNDSNSSNAYSNSTLQESVNEIVSSFSQQEQKAISKRTLEVQEYLYEEPFCDGIAGSEVNDAALWPLSSKEAAAIENNSLAQATSNWWLRSPGSRENLATFVSNGGGLHNGGHDVKNPNGVRPAFFLSTDSVLFTSPAESGKVSGSVGKDALIHTSEYTGTQWKLTIKDPSRNLSVSNVVQAGKTISFDYSGAVSGENEYISAVIVDNRDWHAPNSILYYGRIMQVDGIEHGVSGNASIEIPTKIILDDSVTLHVFNEQYNGDKMTDYSGEPVRVIPTSTTPGIYGIKALPEELSFYGNTYTTSISSETIYNTGSEPTGELSIEISGQAAPYLTAAPDKIPSIAPYSNTDIQIRCYGAPAGRNTATATVKGGPNIELVSFDIVIDVTGPYAKVPALTEYTYSRSSDNSASISFKSDVPGEFYYQVVEHGANAPVIDISGAGTQMSGSVNGSKTEFSIENLTAGDKDVYIIAKNSEGAVGVPFKIVLWSYDPFAVNSIEFNANRLRGYDIRSDSYSMIYFGKNMMHEPNKWRLLDNLTNTGERGLFLLSERLLGREVQGVDVKFDGTPPISSTYQGSDVQKWCQKFAENNLKPEELAATISITKSDPDYMYKYLSSINTITCYSSDAAQNNLSGDRVFCLSLEEVSNHGYGFTSKEKRRAFYSHKPTEADEWHLRSTWYDDILWIDHLGGFLSPDFDGGASVRPALNLDLDSILFYSKATGGKLSKGTGETALKSISAYNGNEWKLTLKDENRKSFRANVSGGGAVAMIERGGSVKIDYSGAKTGTNEFVSAILTDANGKALYYGNIAKNSASASGVGVYIPTAVTAGSYTLKLFNEQCNGDKKTDYSSDFISIPLTVTAAGNTTPILTAGEVNRTGDTSATVKFTSDKAGQYYYQVVDEGAAEPVIDTTEAGASCGTIEQTIALNSLTAGAKDIYIVVKDATNTLSDKLKITIPAYIPSTVEISFDKIETVASAHSGTTRLLILYFTDKDGHPFTGLDADDINIYGATKAIYQNNDGKTVRFYINNITVGNGGEITVSVSKPGYHFIPASKKAKVTVDAPSSYMLPIKVESEGSGTAWADKSRAAEGTTITLNANPNMGHHFKKWRVIYPLYIIITGNTFTMPSDFVEIRAIFEKDAPPPTEYSITVQTDGNGTANANKSVAVKDTEITLTANANSGYRFKEWQVVSGGVSIAGNKFIMPDEAVTVKAIFEADNASTSSSSGQTVEENPLVGTDNTKNSAKAPDKILTAELTIQAILGQNNIATAEIPEKALAQAIQKAKEEAKKSGHKDKALSVKADLSLPKNAKGVTLELSENALNTLISEGVSGLDIETPLLRIRFDKNALSSIKEQSKGSIKISAAPNSKLSENAKKIVGTRPVFDITISYEETKQITKFGNGIATVFIPYMPTKNEATGGLYAVYIDEKGQAKRIDGSAYDGNSGSVIFTTSHFSIYAVGYTAPSEKYTDIGNHWAKDAIDYVVGRGLITGADDKFSPNAPMTRQMLVTALGKLSEVNVKGYTESSFTDVAKDSSYSPYIEWAYKNGIVSGIGESKFAPERSITREEIAVIFERYAKVTGYTLPVTREASVYADEKNIGNAYKTAVTAMQQAGIMMGGKGNKFNPKGNATRAEVSSMLSRYIKLTISPETAAGWALNDVGKYLFYKDGKALTGEQVINGVKYFFNDNGVLKTGWVKDGSSYRYYAGNIMQKGWLKLKVSGEEKSYYMNKDGLLETGKWIKIDGKWYYFHADGSLAVNTEIDGYTVDENGVRKEKK